MSARVVAILLACCFVSFAAGWIVAWWAEPWEQRIRCWWQARDLRKHRGDFYLWRTELHSKDRSKGEDAP